MDAIQQGSLGIAGASGIPAGMKERALCQKAKDYGCPEEKPTREKAQQYLSSLKEIISSLPVYRSPPLQIHSAPRENVSLSSGRAGGQHQESNEEFPDSRFTESYVAKIYNMDWPYTQSGVKNLHRYLLKRQPLIKREEVVSDEVQRGLNTALWKAVRAGDEWAVRVLLCYGAKANSTDLYRSKHAGITRCLLEGGASAKSELGQKALCEAVDRGNSEQVKLLLSYGADPIRVEKVHWRENGTDSHGRAIRVDRTCREDVLLRKSVRFPAITSLLVRFGAEINWRYAVDNYKTALHLATREGFRDTVKVLLELGAEANVADGSRKTPLLYAFEKGKKEIISLLLKHGADPNQKWFPGQRKYCETPLHTAMQTGQLDIVQILLSNKADPNIRDDKSNTPLGEAARVGSQEMVSLLLDHGADPNLWTQTGSFYPADIAAQHGHMEIVRLLLKRGGEIHPENSYYLDAMSKAARENNSKDVKFFLENKVDPNPSYSHQSRPLCSAVCHPSIVKLLLKGGAKADVGGRYASETPLHLAARTGPLTTAKLLLRKGASPNFQNSLGETPLHLAARKGRKRTVALLLKHKADPNFARKTGHTALMESTNYPDICELLLEHGAKTELQEEATGNTALHIARKQGGKRRAKTARALLLHGADARAKNKEGRTPNQLRRIRRCEKRVLQSSLQS